MTVAVSLPRSDFFHAAYVSFYLEVYVGADEMKVVSGFPVLFAVEEPAWKIVLRGGLYDAFYPLNFTIGKKA